MSNLKHVRKGIDMVTYNEPLAIGRADPYVLKHNGKYYFTATVPLYDKIVLRCADTINGLTEAPERIVWVKHEKGRQASHVWAPELHFVMGKWVIYYSAGDYPGIWRIRPYALVCDSDDPMIGNWKEAGPIKSVGKKNGDPLSFTCFSLDMTVFQHKGEWYTIWAEKIGHLFGVSNLYIAKLETPFKLKTVQVQLTTPDYDWERIGFWVNEGPAIIKNKGKIYLTYSASETSHHYCMGMLSVDEDADLLDPACWTKLNKPVCTTDESVSIYGPGHNCFVMNEDDTKVLCIFHARDHKEIECEDPLDDQTRHARVMEVEFDETGAPVFDLKKRVEYIKRV